MYSTIYGSYSCKTKNKKICFYYVNIIISATPKALKIIYLMV